MRIERDVKAVAVIGVLLGTVAVVTTCGLLDAVLALLFAAGVIAFYFRQEF